MPKIQYDMQGFPIYDSEAGWKDHGEFEAAALNDMDRIAAKKQASAPLAQNGTTMGKLTSDMLPTVGAVGGGII